MDERKIIEKIEEIRNEINEYASKIREYDPESLKEFNFETTLKDLHETRIKISDIVKQLVNEYNITLYYYSIYDSISGIEFLEEVLESKDEFEFICYLEKYKNHLNAILVTEQDFYNETDYDDEVMQWVSIVLKN